MFITVDGLCVYMRTRRFHLDLFTSGTRRDAMPGEFGFKARETYILNYCMFFQYVGCKLYRHFCIIVVQNYYFFVFGVLLN